jgi:hypothetical protein
MEVCRLLGAAAIFFAQDQLPVGSLALILFAPLLISSLLSTIRRRLIIDIGIHFFGAVLSFLFLFPSPANLSFSWLSAAGWGILIFLFYFRGAYIGYSGIGIQKNATRFDIGLGILLLVAFISATTSLPAPNLAAIAAAYLIFGIVSLFLSRIWESSKEFSVSRKPAAILAVVLLSLTFAGAGFVILLPLLTNSAELAYTTIKAGTAPFRYWLTSLLIRILTLGRIRLDQSPGTVSQTGSAAGTGAAEQPLGTGTAVFIKWLIIAFLVGFTLYLVIIAAGKIWRLIKQKKGSEDARSLKAILTDLIAWFMKLVMKVKLLPGTSTSLETGAFRALTRWGRLAGVRKQSAETAAEYGKRLTESIPEAPAGKIETIIALIYQQWYGSVGLTSEQQTYLKQSMRHLRSPNLFRHRLLARFRKR